MRKRSAALITMSCLAALAAVPASAGVQERLGKLMALPAIAGVCALELTPAQNEVVDKLGPKLQREAGLSDEQANQIVVEIAKGIKPEECPDFKANWAVAAPKLIEQAQDETN